MNVFNISPPSFVLVLHLPSPILVTQFIDLFNTQLLSNSSENEFLEELREYRRRDCELDALIANLSDRIAVLECK